MAECWEDLFDQEDGEGLDAKEDRRLIELVVKNNGIKVFSSFVKFINRKEVVDEYSDTALDLCYQVIDELKTDGSSYWRVERDLLSLILSVYDANHRRSTQQQRNRVSKCLDLWDYMFEHNLSVARKVSNAMMDI